MKLSEAIRIGASWSPQIKGVFKTKKGTCVLGSALEGCFGTIALSNDNAGNGTFWDFKRIEYKKLSKKFPYLEEQVQIPTLGKDQGRLLTVMWQLNDLKCWTREQIADWVEKLENENGWTGTEDIKEEVPNGHREKHSQTVQA